MRRKLLPLILIWLFWSIIMVGYQFYVHARLDLVRPDYAVSWTPSETRANSQSDKPYLMEPFLNSHVSWDSEYYLSIAVGGYDDPIMRAIPASYTWSNPKVALKQERPDWISMNYAFFPFYPLLMRALIFPLSLLGLNIIATATLAGVLVSLLGALGAMLALYDLGRAWADEATGLRAAFYLLIYPAGMFLAVIYTEGLFLGLSFGALAMARRRKWIWAALLAACATWTRASGGLLLLPLAYYWWKDGGLDNLVDDLTWGEVGKALLVASPVWAYLAWQALLGQRFHIVEDRFFSRGLLAIPQTIGAWTFALRDALSGKHSEMAAYYLVEVVAILFAFTVCALSWKRDRILALYSLATIFFSLTSGVAQGMHRYVMAAPVIFLLPACWGKHEAFDRTWTLGCALLMGIFAIMFGYDFWAG